MRGRPDPPERAPAGVRGARGAGKRDLDRARGPGRYPDPDPDLVRDPAPTLALDSPPAMSDRIDRALLHHVAELASLSLSDAEADKLTGELAAIVRYVSELDAVDTSNVPPTAHVQLQSASLRADEVQPCLSHEDALAQAPRAAHGGFAVPAFEGGTK